MKKQHHLRVQLGLFVAIISATFLVILAGCDDANTPEQPPYRLLAQYQTPASPQFVTAQGNYVAVASGTAGALLLDARDLNNIQTLYLRSVPAWGMVTTVGLDTLHHYLFAGTDGSVGGDPYPVYNYLTDQRLLGTLVSGPVQDLIFEGVQDTFTIWISDKSDGLVAKRFCRNPGDTTWGTGCDFPYADNAWHPSGTKMYGYGRSSDGIFAVAVEKGTAAIHGIHLITQERVSLPGESYYISTPGSAYDCAWYGDKYLIVADQLMVTVIDVDSVRTTSDSLRYPKVASSLFIPTADRLQKVVMDGSYACFMDIYDGIYIVDVADPKAPKLVQMISLPQPTSIYFDNGRLYATDMVLGLLVYGR